MGHYWISLFDAWKWLRIAMVCRFCFGTLVCALYISGFSKFHPQNLIERRACDTSYNLLFNKLLFWKYTMWCRCSVDCRMGTTFECQRGPLWKKHEWYPSDLVNLGSTSSICQHSLLSQWLSSAIRRQLVYLHLKDHDGSFRRIGGAAARAAERGATDDALNATGTRCTGESFFRWDASGASNE